MKERRTIHAFASWSGGKDSCLALHRAIKQNLEIRCLFSMLKDGDAVSAGHGLKKEILDAQAKAVGIPIRYGNASWSAYEDEFKRVVESLKEDGIEGGVFGDINLSEHREWVERVCKEIGITAFLPLWNEEYNTLLNEFTRNGFEAVIISVRSDLIGEEWLGQPFNTRFIEYLQGRGLDLMGEQGEYHTLVTFGPLFKRRLTISTSEYKMENKKWVPKKLKFTIE
ncbi:Dph6-related ATP pyrophosphatase [[Eubacterium] cellulosolvens]